MGNASPIDGRPQSEVQVGPDKLEVVASFCYLGDMISAGGGCEIVVTIHVKTTWKKFRDLLPVLTSDMGRITLESNALNYHYLPKMSTELALPLLDFEKVMH